MEKLKEVLDFELTETKYFWIAIVTVGTIGIWLPFILGSEVELKEIPILFTTYYVSIYFSGCIDSVKNKIKSLSNIDDKNEIFKRFLNIVSLILVAIGLVLATVLLNKNYFHYTALFLALVGTVISLGLWWRNNWEGKTYDQNVRDDVRNKHSKSW